MTVEIKNHKNNVVLGSGEIYIDVHDSDGNLQGERYLGDSAGATLSLTAERTTIQSGDGAVARDLVDKIRSVSRVLGFTIRDASLENWALFLIAEQELKGGLAAVSVKDELGAAINAKANRWYQIGATEANPMGYEEVAIAAIGDVKYHASSTSSLDPLTADATNNFNAAGDWDHSKFQLDPGSGRFYAKADGYFEFSGTAPKGADQAHVSADASEIICALRYIEAKDGTGKGRNFYAFKCNLVPSGEVSVKSRDTEQQLAFSATVLDPGGSRTPFVIAGEAPS